MADPYVYAFTGSRLLKLDLHYLLTSHSQMMKVTHVFLQFSLRLLCHKH